MGIVLCLVGVVLGVLSFISLSGPNSLAAMRQARSYLKEVYGYSKDGYSFSCHNVPDQKDTVIVHYKYSGKEGNLRASWDGSKYTFIEDH